MIQKSEPEIVVQTSLGLKALCQKLEGISGLKVLELGPARSANIEFWSHYGSRIFIADLRSSLPLPYLAEDQQFPESEWDRILGLPKGGIFDVILAWDLLNYLEISSVSSLIHFLKQHCHPGAVLFTLIFDQKQMPEKITVYRISDESHLIYECSGSEMKSCPRHQPRAIESVMSHFRTSNSFRLRNGIVEYLFIYEGESPE